jgi:phosphohistidine phosphatase
MRPLFLLRHAKSSWDDPDLEDHDRPLAPRGRRAAGLVADHLLREGIKPSLVLCSSARRTRETLERLAPALGEGVETSVERGLYAASERELLARLRKLPEELPSAMLIGHNPGIQRLALSLASGGGDLERLKRKYPTAALATLAIRGTWRELGPDGAELAAFVRPKDL